MKDCEKDFDRRTLFKGAAALAGGTLFTVGCGSGNESVSAAEAGTTIAVSTTNPVVETTAGKVRGFTRNGIHTFKGIPYARDHGGAARLLPARQAATMDRHPQHHCATARPARRPPRTGWLNDENAFLFQWDDGQPGEDCLRVNLWTPGWRTVRNAR